MKNKLISLLIVIFVAFTTTLEAQQDYYSVSQRQLWMQKAEENKPKLVETVSRPTMKVRLVKDASAFQGWKAVDDGQAIGLYSESFKKQTGIILDLGGHYTGYLSFSLAELNSDSDSPVRIKFTLGEIPSELCIPFDPYNGTIARSWLQDEIMTIEQLPKTVTIPRRMSGRYLKIELLGSSPYADFRFSDIHLTATTSVRNKAEQLSIFPNSLIYKIDKIGLKTLKECMQTVYEDGPKRDHRLWIGDMYLQMLANNYSFKEHNLSKRCLYLMAGLARPDGYLYSNMFESPVPHAQSTVPVFLYEYSLIYNSALKCYFDATNDKATCLELWPVAKRQVEKISSFLDESGLFSPDLGKKQNLWLLIDWKDNLDRQTAIQGVYIYSLRNTYELAKSIGKEKEVAYIPGLIKKMTKAVRTSMFDVKRGVYVSGLNHQVSYASQAWMILAKVVTPNEGQDLISSLYKTENVVRPGGPYLYHYFIQALIDCKMTDEAKRVLISYWGDMVKKKADTFWEVYDPENDFSSPYNFVPVNSYCHAWSCTPVYFIRKYPKIFQNK